MANAAMYQISDLLQQRKPKWEAQTDPVRAIILQLLEPRPPRQRTALTESDEHLQGMHLILLTILQVYVPHTVVHLSHAALTNGFSELRYIDFMKWDRRNADQDVSYLFNPVYISVSEWLGVFASFHHIGSLHAWVQFDKL